MFFNVFWLDLTKSQFKMDLNIFEIQVSMVWLYRGHIDHVYIFNWLNWID